ncbi:hypothetical protein HELRODRAFT_137616, partial [Helobdella robusta]|uniref:Disintegrin domain-containing protein n=1 Tax=Helobdella robusta TaxID=6412 RepID=T1EIL8_HELRO
CGNGWVDVGEDCDCGAFPKDICSTKCCDMAACRFTSGSKCATGLCCDLNNCKIRKAGTLCRPSSDECDIEDLCGGRSNLCADLVKTDGTMC